VTTKNVTRELLAAADKYQAADLDLERAVYKHILLACLSQVQASPGWWGEASPRWWVGLYRPDDVIAQLKGNPRTLPDAFDHELRAFPGLVHYVEEEAAAQLLEKARKLDDALPVWACRRLGLKCGSTYADAAGLLGRELRTYQRRRSSSPQEFTPRPVRDLTYAERVRYEAGNKGRACRVELPPQLRLGRPRRYCSDACRARAHRRRIRASGLC
jgi:hypothetical protein